MTETKSETQENRNGSKSVDGLVDGLVNCPFCGSENVKECPVFDGWNQEIGSRIKRNGCKIQTADYLFGEAKKLWNNRAR